MFLINELGLLTQYFDNSQPSFVPISSLILLGKNSDEDYNYSASICRMDKFYSIFLDINYENERNTNVQR